MWTYTEAYESPKRRPQHHVSHFLLNILGLSPALLKLDKAAAIVNPYSVSGPWRRQLEVSWTPGITSPRLWSCLIVIETSQSHHDHDGSIMESVGFEKLSILALRGLVVNLCSF